MPRYLSHLRRWFAGAFIGAVLLVTGAYFYGRHRVQNALKQVPEKIGLEVKQSATGFTVSKSEQGRTLFTIRAGKAIQFKQGRRAELHDVEIIVYGRDSSRFDRISGSDFEYDQQTGDATAKGDVEIDLEANPSGLTNPDQAPPKDLKNPIHLKTSGLVFNQKTGNAYTRERIDFRLPQVSGSAVGVTYVAASNDLTLRSEVSLAFSGPTAGKVTATNAVIHKNPRVVILANARVQNGTQHSEADAATLYLREDNTIGRVVALGNVRIDSSGTAPSQAQASQLELNMSAQRSTIQTAVLTGDVHFSRTGAEPMEGSAALLRLMFGQNNSVTQARAQDHVHLLRHPSPASANAQDLEVHASTLDMFFNADHQFEHAQASGETQITLQPANAANAGQRTTVSADTFDARFDSAGQLASVHGAPNARIVSQFPKQRDRVSTSDVVDAVFQPGGGIQSIEQQGHLAYVDGERKASGDHARYTPADQVLVLTGSPRVTEGGMSTSARSIRFNRSTGDALAEGDVKTTYSDLKPQAGGALLSASSPIHVTAHSMTVHNGSHVAIYAGNARLWQDANVVQAQSLEFDRDHRSMVAQGTVASNSSPKMLVSTTLVQTDKSGKTTQVAMTSQHLTYADNDRQAHFDGDVVAKSGDITITAQKIDAILQARGSGNQPQGVAGKLDKIIARQQVVITQPGRRAEGELLAYTAAEDKFVLSGGSPSIFDAEHGKITGVSLTFFRHDDRVLVEGNDSSPTITQTQVAR